MLFNRRQFALELLHPPSALLNKVGTKTSNLIPIA